MSKLQEKELLLPFLKVLSLKPIANTTDIKEFISNTNLLSEEDLKRSETRPNEKLWEQQVRNIIAHRNGRDYNDFFTMESKGTYSITQQGLDYLELHSESLEAIVTNNHYSREDTIKALKDHRDKIFIQEVMITEGNILYKQSKTFKRSYKLRKCAIKEFSKNGKIYCEICSFDYDTKYTKIGKGFIEIHHKKPIAFYDDNFTKTLTKALDNLSPVCANCHRMIHRKSPCYDIQEMKLILK